MEMEQKREAIAAFDGLIAKTLGEHPDRFIVASLPGAGPVLEPRLIAAIGSIRERFDSAHSLNCYAGIAPVKESSGKACWIHWRWNCPKFIRQTFHEWAGCSIRYCIWAREFYDKKRAAGMDHHPAVRALAFKWIRIYYRCWRDRVPYSEGDLPGIPPKVRRQDDTGQANTATSGCACQFTDAANPVEKYCRFFQTNHHFRLTD
jgi:hypothetical protein